MIIAGNYGNVTCIKMGRDLDGQVLYWVAAYLVDDLLIVVKSLLKNSDPAK